MSGSTAQPAEPSEHPAAAPAPNSVHGLSASKPFRVYSRSTIFYWWPVWILGFLFALVSYLDGGYMAWVPAGTEAKRDWAVQSAPGQVETMEGLLLPKGDEARHFHLLPPPDSGPADSPVEPEQPHMRMARQKFLGFVFAIVLLLICLHSSLLMRGYRGYFNLALGAMLVLAVPLLEVYAPQAHVWYWIRYLLYELPDVYLSADGYLFISSVLLLIWLYAFFVYDRLTYMEFAEGQVRVVQEIGEGQLVFDATALTFEKKRDDVFRHDFLGLGFLRWFGLGYLTSGAGDLSFRTGGPNPQAIEWPNVLDVHRTMRRIERVIAAREVV
jgi:hypothetical protein